MRPGLVGLLGRAVLAAACRPRSSVLPALAPARRAPRRHGRSQHEYLTILPLLLVLALSGCSGSQVIDLYAADYRVTAATAGDAQLLHNILRAKDNLPIHFSDLSIIHGSIQWTAGATASIPVAQNGSLTPTTVSPAVGLQNAPTFDLGTLDTQAFTKGILTPIDAKIVKQFFDQGVDPRIMMLLFFSEYQTADRRRFMNNMACDLTDPGKYPERGCLNQVYAYLRAIDRLFRQKGLQMDKGKQLQANIYQALRPVGGPLSGAWTLSQLDSLRQLDTTKYKLIGKQLYSISEPRLAICYQQDYRLKPLFDEPVGQDACDKSEVIVPSTTRRSVALSIRSTYEIIQFLGQVLRFQEEKGDNRCITLDASDRTCDTGEVLFQVNSPVGAPVVGTRYAGGWYALYDRPCLKNFQQQCDYSLQVLALLELLLNANKVATDIPSTPRVQVVP